MRTKTIMAPLVIAIAALIAACGGGGSPGDERVIKSATAGGMTVTLSNATGELKDGENELFISFTDASGKPADITAASLNFHMAAMGTMPEMNDRATLTTTDTPGKFRAKVDIEMAATWEAIIQYEGPQGSGQVTMTVQAR